MVRNILGRLLQAVCVLLGVALLIFIMLRIVPGNPIATLMGEHADRAVIERMTAELGLDQPILRQFIRYLMAERWISAVRLLPERSSSVRKLSQIPFRKKQMNMNLKDTMKKNLHR